MKSINITRRNFEKLQRLRLSNLVMNQESTIYLMKFKNRWKQALKVLKILFRSKGDIFSTKLFTISYLMDHKDEIAIDELVIPDSLLSIDGELRGFIMPYIEGENFQDILNRSDLSIKEKIKYFKEIGELLEKLKQLRTHSFLKDIYLNEIHESNFVLNPETNKLNVVDLDSAKVDPTFPQLSKYLSPFSPISKVTKYKPVTHSVGGSFEVSEDTDIYCYVVMIFKYFLGINITRLSIEDFYLVLEYLQNIGLDKELVQILSFIYLEKPNENPKDYLEAFQKVNIDEDELRLILKK